MRKRDRLKIQNRLTAAILSMLLVITVTFTLSDFKPANAHSVDGMSPGGQNGIMKTEGDNIEILTHEGESCNKVVYAEDLTKKETKQLENEAELEPLVKEEGSNIYQADLTAKEEKALEKEDGVIVEDNMGFDASTVKEDMGGKKTIINQKDEENNGASEEEGVWIQQDTADKISEKINADWNRDMINADGEKDSTPAADAVKVAVMDSGVDYISDANIKEAVNLVEDEQGYEDMLIDMTGHGTSVATIINSIAPEAEIYSVRVLDKDNKGTLSRVAAGIYWCIDNDVDIINMSFGTLGRSEILNKAINEAKEKGILIIASAGNDQEAGVEYPAKYDDVVAVGSVDPEGEATENSARGPEVELTAPGEEILAQSMLGMYTEVNGTSVAAPHVTAAAAKLWEKDRTKSDEFIRGLMEASSNKTLTEEKDDAGIIDLEYAEDIYDKFEENHVKKVPENKSEVTTYEDGEVDARWHKSDHKGAVDFALRSDMLGTNYLNNEQAKILKNGAVYPDTGALQKNVYHGSRNTNWLASYIYITSTAEKISRGKAYPTMAAVFPNCSSADRTKLSYIKDALNKDVKSDKIACYKAEKAPSGWLPWSSGDVLNGSGATAKNKALFVYGLALHDLTDTFAHATYMKTNNGILKPIVHSDSIYDKEHEKSRLKFKSKGGWAYEADDPSSYHNRWRDAAYASMKLIKRAKSAATDGKTPRIGIISDFAPNDYTANGESKSRGYYLDRPIFKANTIEPSSVWNKVFAGVNCKY